MYDYKVKYEGNYSLKNIPASHFTTIEYLFVVSKGQILL